MPRPKREEVHRHFELLPDARSSTVSSGAEAGVAAGGPSDGAQTAEHGGGDAAAAAAAAAAGQAADPAASPGHCHTPDGTPLGKTFKHVRVRCRHCNWRSKRDASRQAAHLSHCAEYRAWCELHGEAIVGLTATPRRREGRAGRARGGDVDMDDPRDDAQGVEYSADAQPADARQLEVHGRSNSGGAGMGFLPPTPVPTNPRTGVFQGQHGLPVGPGTPGGQQQTQQTQGQTQQQQAQQHQQTQQQTQQQPHHHYHHHHRHHAGRYGHAADYVGTDETDRSVQAQGLGDAERRRLNILYARALVAIGIKDNDFYDRTRHPQMCAFLKALHPGYEPPPKEELGALVVREFFGGLGGSGNGSGDASGTGLLNGVGDDQGGAEGQGQNGSRGETGFG